MAFRDSDGKITIDEVAAEKDIKQLRLSIEKMENAITELTELQLQAEEFSGNTGNRIQETAIEMIKEVKESIQRTQESIDRIQATVAKYQQIDRDVKGIVNAGSQQGGK